MNGRKAALVSMSVATALALPLVASLAHAQAPRAAPSPATSAPASAPARGDVTGCRTNPKFIAAKKNEFSSKSFFSTSERFIKGLVLVDGAAKTRTWQHPSWQKFGWLAAIHYDENGNIFTVPAPRINVFDNKPAEQNRVLKVDSVSGEMKLLAELPTAAPVNEQNPYGALGLAYDCETRLLYVSSIAGSTRAREAGRIFALDPDTGAIKAKLENTDAIGLHLFKLNGEKRVYFGRARAPEVWSVAVDASGAFKGNARFEFSLDGMGPRGDDRARRINFTPTNDMLVWGIEFSVNLVAPTEKQETLYRFRHEGKERGWVRQRESPYEP